MINAILFDLDGTLVDTKDLIITSFQRGYRDVFGKEIEASRIQPLIGIPLIDQMHELAPSKAKAVMEAYREHNKLLHDEMIKYFDGTKEMLETLLAQGHKLGVVTSKRHEPAMEALQSFDLQNYFEFVIGMDDCVVHKPNPDPLLLGAARLGLKNGEPCAYVGDSTFDMQAARSAKMFAIAALWGMFSREDLLKAGAQYEAASPHEIPHIIANL